MPRKSGLLLACKSLARGFWIRPVPEHAPWHLQETADALAVFRVDPETGLEEAEAARRLQAEGPNEMRAAAPVPMWRKILARFQDPLIYLLLVAIAISLGAWAVGVVSRRTDACASPRAKMDRIGVGRCRTLAFPHA